MAGAFNAGFRVTRFLVLVVLPAARILRCVIVAGLFAGSGLAMTKGTGCSPSTGMAGAFDTAFRTTRFLTFVVLAAVPVLRRRRVTGLFLLLLLVGFALVGRVFRREVLGFLRIARRTVRMAGLAVFPVRGFFLFILAATPSAGLGFSLTPLRLRVRLGRCNGNFPLHQRKGSGPQTHAVVPGGRAHGGSCVKVIGKARPRKAARPHTSCRCLRPAEAQPPDSKTDNAQRALSPKRLFRPDQRRINALRTPCVHHPYKYLYTIRTTSVHDPHTIGTP